MKVKALNNNQKECPVCGSKSAQLSSADPLNTLIFISLLAPGENRHFEPGENNQFQPGRNRQSVPGGCSQPRFECRF